ncbi:MAG TPA: hypothetical protein VFP12_11845 [Allosphingosinicella sp.]|nr:hypothetical protein [Allosphingosinicella sp.]
MPRPNPLTPAVRAAFLAALRGGALVEAAAAEVGVRPGTLYRRRRRDPGFDAEWTAAAEASQRWEYRKAPGAKARLVRTKRRLRFGGARRAAYLAELARTCNSSDSARWAGVDPTTICRHLRRDPGFARDCAAALAMGYAALELRLAEEQAAARRRLDWRAIEPTGRMTGDFDEGMRLLARWTRPDGSIGPRFVSRGRQRRWSFEEAIVLLERRLRGLGIKIIPSS